MLGELFTLGLLYFASKAAVGAAAAHAEDKARARREKEERERKQRDDYARWPDDPDALLDELLKGMPGERESGEDRAGQ